MRLEKRYRVKTARPNAPYLVGDIPTEVKVSTTFETWTVDLDTGKSSPVRTTTIPVYNKDEYDTRKDFFGHHMRTIGKFAGNLEAYLESFFTDFGNTAIWLHCEGQEDVDRLIEAVEILERNKRPWFAGVVTGGAPGWIGSILRLTAKCKYNFRLNGQIVIGSYNHPPQNTAAMWGEITGNGFSLDDVTLFATPAFPHVPGGAADVQQAGLFNEKNEPVLDERGIQKLIPEWSDDRDYPMFGGIGNPQDADMVKYLVYHYPPMRAIAVFAAENATAEGMIANAHSIAKGTRETGTYGYMGLVNQYASVGGTADVGAIGLLRVIESQLALPPNQRVHGGVLITDNDTSEMTWMGWLPNKVMEGLGTVIKIGAGFVGGNNMPHPAPERVGVHMALVPAKKAFLENASKVVYTEDKMFYRHLLHPSDIKPRVESPDMFKLHDRKYDEAFPYTMYANPHSVDVVVSRMRMANNKITLYFWATKDGTWVEINGVRSEPMPYGLNVFELADFGSFRGNPKFSQGRGTRRFRTCWSVLPITDDIFPGCFIPIEFFDNGLPYQTKPTVTISKSGLITAKHAEPIEVMRNKGFWEPYTEPIQETQNRPAQYYMFRTAGIEGEINASEVVLSKAITAT